MEAEKKEKQKWKKKRKSNSIKYIYYILKSYRPEEGNVSYIIVLRQDNNISIIIRK